jgi:4-hydroxy-2-oxoheptanedioate aldolase
MDNFFLDKIKNNQKPLGTFFFMGNASLAECLGLAGLDYFIADMEHGPFDIESSLEIVRGAELRKITPMARVKDSSRASILKALDIGMRGIVVPNIQSVAEAEQVVAYGKYFPKGQRGLASARGAGFGFADFALDLGSYMKVCNEKTLLLPQCETKGCLEHIEEIAALDGVDGIFIGPFDLSAALGKPAQFDRPEFQEALKRIQEACKAAGKPAIMFAMNAESAKKYLQDGFDSVTVATDAAIYINAFKDLIRNVKNITI